MFYRANSINPLAYFQKSTFVMRAISFSISTILIFFIFATPSFAEGVKVMQERNRLYVQNSAKRQSQSVNSAIEILKAIKTKKFSKINKEQMIKTLKMLKKDIEKEDQYATQEFDKMLTEIKEKKLPVLFEKRVKKMRDEYTKRKKNFSEALNAATTQTQIKKDIDLSWYKSNQGQKFDPNNLPYDLRPNKKIKPKTSKKEFISQGFINQPLPHYAALGDFDYSTLADASNLEYLAQSDEVQITQAIKDKAAELNYDPVAIYDYVKNNIEFVPTWGAVQSAELTLGAKRGNAMDISSLLIALFRASDIPARYVHGSINVEAEKFKNWIGGFGTITSAFNFASKGGIPIATYPPEAGKIQKVMIEHVWVEVVADYFPSRGAKNLRADSWIPLDASYKQYEYSDGIDMQSVADIDINSTAESFVQSGDINETAGYVMGFDTQILEDALNDAQVKIKNYIDENYDTNTTTLYDIIGGKKIIQETCTHLPSSLPNHTAITGTRYAKLPAGLQQKMTFYIAGTSEDFLIDEMMNGKRTFTLPMAKLNNEKVTISFAPATQADEDALNALLPDGEITDESQLPNTIPLYINVKPQVKLNGEVIFELGETSLGETYTLKQTLTKPTQTLTFGQPREMISGGYYAVNTIVQSISIKKLRDLQSKIQETQEILNSDDQTKIAALTREDIMGDMVYAASLSYYAQMIAQGKMAIRPLKTNFEIAGSSGIIGYKPAVDKLYGMPISLAPGGMNCDLIDIQMVENINTNDRQLIQSNQQLGVIGSSLEHQVLEQLFATDTQAQGFSAVKAIQLANQQGQKIYTITKDNYQEIIPKLQLAPTAIADIQSAAQAGYSVTTHEKRISINGYTGEGYIILNDRGVGLWMINGGMYGGVYSNIVHQQTLFGLSTGTIKDQREATNLTEKVLKDIVGSFLVILSVTYPKDVQIQPFAGFNGGSMLSVKFQISAAEVMKKFATLTFSIASYHPRFGRITNYLVYWYFYGEGMPVDLHDVYNAGELFEKTVSGKEIVKGFMLRNKTCNTIFQNDNLTTSNVYEIPELYAIAVSRFYAEGTCDNTICYYHFYIRDRFEDALDLGIDDFEGNQEAYGATPYPINYDFYREQPCE